MLLFNIQMLKLSAQGVTVTTSSGDEGVSNPLAGCSCSADSGSLTTPWTGLNTWNGTGYFPQFPATSPYVTAVGATMGVGGATPSVGDIEVSCDGHGGA